MHPTEYVLLGAGGGGGLNDGKSQGGYGLVDLSATFDGRLKVPMAGVFSQ